MRPAKIPNGYFKIARLLFKHEISAAPLHVRWTWLWLIGKALWEDGDKLKKGQVLTTLRTIADVCSYYAGYRKVQGSRKDAWRALEWLRERDMIATTKTTRGVIITISNYETYQNGENYERDNEKPTKRTTNATRTRQECPHGSKEVKELEETKKKKQPPAKKRGRANPFADAFKAAFDEHFPTPYEWQDGDFVQLTKLCKANTAVTPDAFAQCARWCWSRGEYTPSASLTIRGLCSSWAQQQAKMQSQRPNDADDPDHTRHDYKVRQLVMGEDDG